MNAGANGGETKDVLIEATGISRDGSKHTFTNAEMKFVYRNSGVDPSIIFTSARFRGAIAAPEAIRARMNEVQAHRETAQPIREKTGGSTFQNPPGPQRLEADRCRGLPRPSRRRRAGVGNALQFPDQYRRCDRPRYRKPGRNRARTGEGKLRN